MTIIGRKAVRLNLVDAMPLQGQMTRTIQAVGTAIKGSSVIGGATIVKVEDGFLINDNWFIGNDRVLIAEFEPVEAPDTNVLALADDTKPNKTKRVAA